MSLCRGLLKKNINKLYMQGPTESPSSARIGAACAASLHRHIATRVAGTRMVCDESCDLLAAAHPARHRVIRCAITEALHMHKCAHTNARKYTHTTHTTHMHTHIRTHMRAHTHHTHTHHTYAHTHHTYTRTHTHTHTHARARTHTHTCTYTHMHKHTHTYTYTHTHKHTQAQTHTRTTVTVCVYPNPNTPHTQTHTHKHTRTHTHKHTRTHTHKHTTSVTYNISAPPYHRSPARQSTHRQGGCRFGPSRDRWPCGGHIRSQNLASVSTKYSTQCQFHVPHTHTHNTTHTHDQQRHQRHHAQQ